MTESPDFRSPDFLLAHVRHTLAFYAPRAFDGTGGFHQFLLDDGTIYDRRTRHLVSSTRYAILWGMAARHFGGEDGALFAGYARHAAEFLRRAHLNPATGGYAWQLQWDGANAQVEDATNHCYGLAFVLLAYTHAFNAGMSEARGWIDETWETLERRFWLPEHGLYADEASADWSVLDGYRGQNANMHMVEACLAAFEATGEQRFLDRAELVAGGVCNRLASQTNGMVWEHYDANWRVDADYNRGDASNIFRPWGYQPGHFTEWARLLLNLERHRPQPWMLVRAESLFEVAMARSWDEANGGLHYGFAPDGSICFADKYHWVQCETLATAAVLGARTGKPVYWDWYQRLWAYCWQHWVDHEHGAWFRILTVDNRKLTDQKSPAGKVDYHTTGSCYAMLAALRAA